MTDLVTIPLYADKTVGGEVWGIKTVVRDNGTIQCYSIFGTRTRFIVDGTVSVKETKLMTADEKANATTAKLDCGYTSLGEYTIDLDTGEVQYSPQDKAESSSIYMESGKVDHLQGDMAFTSDSAFSF